MNNSSKTFNSEYYCYHLGDLPYRRSTPEWHNFYRPIADAIVLSLRPRKVFDAGCAIGFLVEMLWDRGVETHGRDISDFAISQVRADVRPWCEVGSIADPIEGQHDLVLCIEVLEHMAPDEAVAAIRSMTAAAPRILFSSSPTDLKEATHINVRPTRYWLERFAEMGFAPVVDFDATFLCPHAMLLERSDAGRDERSLAAFAEIIRQRLKLAELNQTQAKALGALQQEIAGARQGAEESAAALKAQIAALKLSEADAQMSAQRKIAEAEDDLRRMAAVQETEMQRLATLKEAEVALALANAQRARTEARQAEIRAKQLEAQSHREQEAHSALLERTRAAEARLRSMERSRALRIARQLRRLSGRIPVLGRAAKLVWWTATLQLPRQWKSRRENTGVAAAIRRTGLFDDDYYVANNPDLAQGDIDPALPSAGFDSAFYLAKYPDVAAAGMNPLLHYWRFGIAEGRSPLPLDAADDSAPTVRSMIQQHCGQWGPIPVFADRDAAPTLTIVTDSVEASQLFGGVGTSLVLGAVMARRMDARLRLVTRHAAPDPAALGEILQAHQIAWDGPTDFVHMPIGSDKPLPLGDKDLVLTTSWWTTRAVLGSVQAARVLYLLQEDERMFYPFGDLRLRCTETLSEPDLRVMVNTKLLFDHLADGPDALPGLRNRGDWFEPAFPTFPRPYALLPKDGKRNFFFYARPNHDRNLYWRGLEVIDAAMREGLLPRDEWNIHFVGRELPDMELPGGVRPTVWAKLPWSEYADLVSQMDLGLCLMDTPHPSYPPIDLAASGAVVVTNTHGPKTSLQFL
jgi:SAM-dependent methyltransferase